MKVIEQGSLTRQATCRRCSTKMEYEPEDVTKITYDSGPTKHFVICPTCKPRLGSIFAFVHVPAPDSVEAVGSPSK